MRHVSLILVLAATPMSMGQVFQGLGILPGRTESSARGISSDGTTVVGGSGPTPWRWTLAGGLQTFGNAPAGFSFNPATDASGDGSTIVGYMNNGTDSFAWRWTQATGVQRVVGVGGAFGPSISSDASTIVGRAEGNLSAVRWTQSTGVQSLNPVTGLPFGNGGAIVGYGVSGNGSIIVGPANALFQINPPLSTFVPYRWTQSTGSVAILDNGQFYNPIDGAGASSVSDDGLRIAGYTGNRTAWLWSAATGYQTIVLNPAPIPGGFIPSISGDGNTVAYREFLWTQSSGTQLLTSVLTSAGCNFTNWTDLRVIDTSFDGRTLCGYGTNPQGQTEAWYATIPGPSSTAALLAMTGIAATRRRRIA